MRTGGGIVEVMDQRPGKDPLDDLAALLAAEAKAAEEAEASSDPDEPLPPHVTVTRGARTFDDILRERPGDPERRAAFKAELLAQLKAERERMEKGMEELSRLQDELGLTD